MPELSFVTNPPLESKDDLVLRWSELLTADPTRMQANRLVILAEALAPVECSGPYVAVRIARDGPAITSADSIASNIEEDAENEWWTSRTRRAFRQALDDDE